MFVTSVMHTWPDWSLLQAQSCNTKLFNSCATLLAAVYTHPHLAGLMCQKVMVELIATGTITIAYVLLVGCHIVITGMHILQVQPGLKNTMYSTICMCPPLH